MLGVFSSTADEIQLIWEEQVAAFCVLMSADKCFEVGEVDHF